MSHSSIWGLRVSTLLHAGLGAAGLAWIMLASPAHVHVRRGTAVWEVSFAVPQTAESSAVDVTLVSVELPREPVAVPSDLAPMEVTLARHQPEALQVSAELPKLPQNLEDCDCDQHGHQPPVVKSPAMERPLAAPNTPERSLAPRPRPTPAFTSTVVESLSVSAAESGQETDEPPHKLANNSPPPYPDDAYRRRQEGRVVLEVQVSPEGTVTSLSILQSSGVAALDQAALDTVRGWRFEPARRAGQNVASVVNVPIRFDLGSR